jgi:hypothetical protein
VGRPRARSSGTRHGVDIPDAGAGTARRNAGRVAGRIAALTIPGRGGTERPSRRTSRVGVPGRGTAWVSRDAGRRQERPERRSSRGIPGRGTSAQSVRDAGHLAASQDAGRRHGASGTPVISRHPGRGASWVIPGRGTSAGASETPVISRHPGTRRYPGTRDVGRSVRDAGHPAASRDAARRGLSRDAGRRQERPGRRSSRGIPGRGTSWVIPPGCRVAGWDGTGWSVASRDAGRVISPRRSRLGVPGCGTALMIWDAGRRSSRLGVPAPASRDAVTGRVSRATVRGAAGIAWWSGQRC